MSSLFHSISKRRKSVKYITIVPSGIHVNRQQDASFSTADSTTQSRDESPRIGDASNSHHHQDSESIASCVYALQHKKQTTDFCIPVMTADNSPLSTNSHPITTSKPELHIKTKKSAIKLFVLEKCLGEQEGSDSSTQKEGTLGQPADSSVHSTPVKKKYKLRINIRDLMQSKDSTITGNNSEWKDFRIDLRDGSVLTLKSKVTSQRVGKMEHQQPSRHASRAPSESTLDNASQITFTDSTMPDSLYGAHHSEDDLSTLIMDKINSPDNQDVIEELNMYLEEKELENQSLRFQMTEMEEKHRNALLSKEQQLARMESEIVSLREAKEKLSQSEKKATQMLSAAQETSERLARENESLRKELQSSPKTSSHSLTVTTQTSSSDNSSDSADADSSSTVTPAQSSSNGTSSSLSKDPVWVQKSIQLYNHIQFLEQEIFSLKRIMDVDKIQKEEKQYEILRKLQFYQQRDEKVESEKQQLKQFVNEKRTSLSSTHADSPRALSGRNWSTVNLNSAEQSIDDLPEQLSNLSSMSPVARLELVVSTLSLYLMDKIESMPHDRLLNDLANPHMMKLFNHLFTVMLEVLGSGLTGPWRLTRRNNVWDLLQQAHMNMFSRNNHQHQALSKEELSLYYSVRKIRRLMDESTKFSWEEKCRAWLKEALNSQQLSTFVKLLMQDEELVAAYYDTNKSEIFTHCDEVMESLQSLDRIPFALSGISAEKAGK